MSVTPLPKVSDNRFNLSTMLELIAGFGVQLVRPIVHDLGPRNQSVCLMGVEKLLEYSKPAFTCVILTLRSVLPPCIIYLDNYLSYE